MMKIESKIESIIESIIEDFTLEELKEMLPEFTKLHDDYYEHLPFMTAYYFSCIQKTEERIKELEAK